MSYALAAAVAVAIILPHGLRLESASPGIATVIWLGAIALRALTAVFCALFVVLLFPTTALFRLITHWCWQAVLPFVTAHLPVTGHALGSATLVLPAFVLAASVVSVSFGLWRAAWHVQRLVRRCALGPGPDESVVVADGDMLVAAAGMRRPKVLVSAGALLALDDEELAASVEHERGHIARRHRYVLVAAELCRALARFLPGTRAALRELRFHLERDADRYAVARHHDPAALASAICKAAASAAGGPPMLALAGGVVARRIRLLLDGDAPGRGSSRPIQRTLATAMVALVALSAGTLPSAAQAGYRVAGQASVAHQCQT